MPYRYQHPSTHLVSGQIVRTLLENRFSFVRTLQEFLVRTMNHWREECTPWLVTAVVLLGLQARQRSYLISTLFLFELFLYHYLNYVSQACK